MRRHTHFVKKVVGRFGDQIINSYDTIFIGFDAFKNAFMFMSNEASPCRERLQNTSNNKRTRNSKKLSNNLHIVHRYTYFMCKFPVFEIFKRKTGDLNLRWFRVNKGQTTWCQSIAHGWFPTCPSLIPTSYLSSFTRYWK